MSTVSFYPIRPVGRIVSSTVERAGGSTPTFRRSVYGEGWDRKCPFPFPLPRNCHKETESLTKMNHGNESDGI